MVNPRETSENKALVQAGFDRWRDSAGSPYELLEPNAGWTIVGSSPLSKTCPNRQAFLKEVIGPFDARMAAPPPTPSVRGPYGDCDMVTTFFDASATAKDVQPYVTPTLGTSRMRTRKSSARPASSIPETSTRPGPA